MEKFNGRRDSVKETEMKAIDVNGTGLEQPNYAMTTIPEGDARDAIQETEAFPITSPSETGNTETGANKTAEGEVSGNNESQEGKETANDKKEDPNALTPEDVTYQISTYRNIIAGLERRRSMVISFEESTGIDSQIAELLQRIAALESESRSFSTISVTERVRTTFSEEKSPKVMGNAEEVVEVNTEGQEKPNEALELDINGEISALELALNDEPTNSEEDPNVIDIEAREIPDTDEGEQLKITNDPKKLGYNNSGQSASTSN